jgi:DNA-binding winged helix-turn-helix (wHTH) protein
MEQGAIQTMDPPVGTPRLYCFEEFLLDVRTGELIRSGTRIPIRAQSLELLLALLDRPSELVTREQLITRL